MDVVHHKSLLVFEGDKFFSIVTIGDLQRAIIANKSFDSLIGDIIDNSSKKYAHTSDTKEDIKK